MNTEQLKMIIEAFSGMQDGATMAFLFWIAKQYLVVLVTGGVFVYAISKLFKLLQYVSSATRLVHVLQGTLGYTPGLVTTGEEKRIVELIRAGQDAELTRKGG